ncbi:hypothetical protein [Streptomyces pakalii]|uniref:Uncharacterized protein n=1 Tax=Streptomyces pakalii TaxID=3036494 RepID=A0ABT7DF31_9ACTN|nr:hypothetical protein [Streptomyces pakalii]MDJ1643101.1 hypothetical protein [Streptomyces pakalii]
MTESAVEALAKRLETVEWSGDFSRTRSRVALMREFMRRSAIWARQTNSSVWPFYDVASHFASMDDIGEEIPAPLIKSVEMQHPIVRDTVRWSLNFAALRDGKIPLPDLPEPFAPLVLMYERGGAFQLDGTGHIEIDAAAIPKGTVEQALNRQPISLDANYLDSLD